jgi:hypothetical protein
MMHDRVVAAVAAQVRGAWVCLVGLALACGLVAAAVAGAQQSPPGTGRVVAIGDVHGDFDAFVGILREAQLVDAERRWIGGRASLVQTGDYLDRGDRVRDVLDLLIALEAEARRGGGRVVVLIGNHEAMNMMADVRDVSREAYASFADAQSQTRLDAAYEAHVKLATKRREQLERVLPADAIPKVFQPVGRAEWLESRPPGFVEYVEAFAANGRYGKWLRAREVMTRVGDTVFLHGGLDPARVPRSVDAANTQARREMSRWDRMRNALVSRDLALPWFTFEELVQAARVELDRAIVEAMREEGLPPGMEVPPSVTRHPLVELPQIGTWSILDPQGPLWFRGFATWSSEIGAVQLDQLQRRLGPVRFVVGHTVVRTARITPRFDGRVFLIDTGMLQTHYKGRASALEIMGGRHTAIYMGEREALLETPAAAER